MYVHPFLSVQILIDGIPSAIQIPREKLLMIQNNYTYQVFELLIEYRKLDCTVFGYLRH